jgi:CheY-like chemotaxis protein/DNA-directed RNA polymerase specialized sigma24 family protein
MSAFATAIHDELPRLRRYAHGTIGSADLGDRCIAACLQRLLATPDVLDPGLPLPLALYRLFHATSGHVEAEGAQVAPPVAPRACVERTERLWQSLPFLPLGERQALMLVAVEGLAPDEAAEVLGLGETMVRDRVARAGRTLLKRTTASVMIIEDEYLLAADLERMVTEMGHAVCGAASGHAEAVAMAARCRPALVLADVRLRGGESGSAAVEEIRRHLDTEVIWVTAHAENLPSVGGHMAAVIEKPVHDAELKQAMGTALSRSFLAGLGKAQGRATVPATAHP